MSDDTNSHSPADRLRQRAANPDPLSMFDSEGPDDLVTPPTANRYLTDTEDPVREVRQRLRAGTPAGAFGRSIARRLTATTRLISMKGEISETVADLQSRVTSRVRNYIVQHPKLLVPVASIACVLIIALLVGFAVTKIEIVPAPRQSALPETARNRTDVVKRSDSVSPVASTVTTRGPRDADAADARHAAPTPTQVKRTVTKSAGIVQRSAAGVRSTPARRTPAADLNEPAPTRSPAPARVVENVPAPAIALYSNPNPTPVVTARSVDPASSNPAPILRATETVPASSNPTRVLSTSDPNANAIYSQQDQGVRPPRMLDIDLPRPAVANWATVRNSMEVVVAENGSVERVKWLGSGERLPDVMLLSRAKLWKFAPAVKDGQAVRYKLVISWDVNP